MTNMQNDPGISQKEGRKEKGREEGKKEEKWYLGARGNEEELNTHSAVVPELIPGPRAVRTPVWVASEAAASPQFPVC